jgi:hypothetical protein
MLGRSQKVQADSMLINTESRAALLDFVAFAYVGLTSKYARAGRKARTFAHGIPALQTRIDLAEGVACKHDPT